MAWSHIQTGTNYNNSGSGSTSLTVSLTGVASGHLLIVRANTYGCTVTSVADGTRNTYTKGVSLLSNSNQASIWYAVASVGGNLTITATFSLSSGTYPSISVDEWSFTPGAISVLATSTNSSLSGTTLSAGTVNFSGPALVCVNVMTRIAATTMTPGTGFTSYEYINDTANSVGLCGEDAVTTSSPQTLSLTVSANQNPSGWTGVGVVFQSTGDIPLVRPKRWFFAPPGVVLPRKASIACSSNPLTPNRQQGKAILGNRQAYTQAYTVVPRGIHVAQVNAQAILLRSGKVILGNRQTYTQAYTVVPRGVRAAQLNAQAILLRSGKVILGNRQIYVIPTSSGSGSGSIFGPSSIFISGIFVTARRSQ